MRPPTQLAMMVVMSTALLHPSSALHLPALRLPPSRSTYFNPKATGKDIIRVSRYVIGKERYF